MSDNIRQDILCQVPARCSVCGALATFPEYLICWSCSEWAQDLKDSFSLRSSTSMPTGGKIQKDEPSLSGAVSSFFVGGHF